MLMMELSPECRNIIKKAKTLAKSLNHRYAGSEHILVSILSCSESAQEILANAGLDSNSFYELSITVLKDTKMSMRNDPPEEDVVLSPKARQVITTAAKFAQEIGEPQITAGSLLLSILYDLSGMCNYLFSQLDVDAEDLRREVAVLLGVQLDEINRRVVFKKNDLPTPPSADQTGSHGLGAQGMPTELSGGDEKSALEQYTIDLTESALRDELPIVIGRNDEVDRVIEVLTRKNKNNPMLIGEPGVGKTAIVEGLAQRVVVGAVPDDLVTCRIMQLDVNAMVAGTQYRGQFEERLKNLIIELKANPEIILFVDEMHQLIGAGSTGNNSMDFSNIIKPELARGEISIIGVTTTNKYLEHIQKDGAFNRRFQKIYVDEPTRKDMLQILKGTKRIFEQHHRINFSLKSLNNIIDKCSRYIPDRRFPDKAMDVMDELGSRLRYKIFKEYFFLTPEVEQQFNRLARDKKRANRRGDTNAVKQIQAREQELNDRLDQSMQEYTDVDNKHLKIVDDTIDEYFSNLTKIPVTSLNQDEHKTLKRLAMNLKKQVIGQDEAIKEISNTIKRARLALHSPTRPIGVFLFLGQTGVGKTHIARVINEQLFGTPDSLIQMNMSELMEEHSVSKIIGSPPGYVGHDAVNSNTMLNKVRERPYSVVLLDEIEKAHPAVLQVLLQMFEEGTITDSQGNDVNFKNCYIIMTSNIGAEAVQKNTTVGFGRSYLDDRVETEAKVKSELSKHMAPELINRIDSIVVFDTLGETELAKICKLEFRHLKVLLREQLKVALTYDQSAVDYIVEDSHEPGYGARPLKRYLNKTVMNAISDEYLKHPDMSHINITANDTGLVYESSYELSPRAAT